MRESICGCSRAKTKFDYELIKSGELGQALLLRKGLPLNTLEQRRFLSTFAMHPFLRISLNSGRSCAMIGLFFSSRLGSFNSLNRIVAKSS